MTKISTRYFTSRKKRPAADRKIASPDVSRIKSATIGGTHSRFTLIGTRNRPESPSARTRRRQSRTGSPARPTTARRAEEINPRHQARIGNQRVRPLADGGHKKGPGDRFDEHRRQISHRERLVRDAGHRYAHHHPRNNDRRRHQDSPQQAHHRLFVPYANISPGEHVEQVAVVNDLAQTSPRYGRDRVRD